VGGHSLGGTVAAIQAHAADADRSAPAVGLLLYASYPAGAVRGSLTAAVESVSGSNDGLATPAKIEASRVDLPADTTFTVIEGGTHAQFGSYGAQPGDGIPTISDERARTLITEASLRFVDSLSG
jgi:dienelactone hydrolase